MQETTDGTHPNGRRQSPVRAGGRPTLWVALAFFLGATLLIALTPALARLGVLAFAVPAALAGFMIGGLVFWRPGHGDGDADAALATARRHEQKLEVLRSAALSITGALDLETVLQSSVDRSRAVIGSRYGAIAVVGVDGSIEHFVTSGIDDATRTKLGAPPTGHGLLGLVIRERQTLRVDDITQHPQSVGFPPGHPAMRQLLAVPLVFEDKVVGSLYLADRLEPGPFTADDEETLQLFGAHVAIAVANARLHADVQRLSLVEERDRISMDLHDGVLQALYATGLGLEGALRDLDQDIEAARESVERSIERLHATIADIRHYIFDLRMVDEEAGDGFAKRLQEMVSDLVEGSGITFEVRASALRTWPKSVQWECWHIVREAVANAIRHSNGSHILVEATEDVVSGTQFEIVVEDNGEGLPTSGDLPEHHRGLRNMSRRAAAIGGTITFERVEPHGTRLILQVTRDAPDRTGRT